MKKAVIAFCAFLMLLVTFQIVSANNIPFSDDFESYTAGIKPPSPWTNLAGGPGIVTNAKAHSGNQSVVVSGGPFSCDSSVLYLGTDYTDYLKYEGWVYANGGEATMGFHEQYSNMAPIFNAIRLRYDGQIYFQSADRDTGFSVKIADYDPSNPAWHRFEVQLDFENLLGAVWWDDALVASQVAISPKEMVTYVWSGGTGSSPLMHLGFMHYNRQAVYFDDFSVSEFEPVPEPASMLLLGSGLIGLAGLRRRMLKK